MRFGILGSTRAWSDDGAEIPLGGPARRALLALLLARAGEPVSPGELMEELGTTAHRLQSQISRLRQVVEIAMEPGGYRLAARPDHVDAHRFLRLAAEGRCALDEGDAERAATLLREALDLWRGPAMADVGSPQSFAAHLEERRLEALADRIEADLRRD